MRVEGKLAWRHGSLSEIRDKEKIDISSQSQLVIASILETSLKPLSLKEVLGCSLDAILSIPFFSILKQGAIFLVDEGSDTLLLEVQRGLPESLQKMCRSLPFGKCLCGRAALTQKTFFASHVGEEHEHQYEGIQPHGHYCVPILSGDKLLGVINTYVPDGHRRMPDEERFFSMAADTLAGVIERKRSEAETKESAEKFRSIFESSSDAIMLLDSTGFFDCNGATLRIFGCSGKDVFLGKQPGEWSPPTQPDGSDSIEAAKERIGTAIRNGRNFFEWTHRRADGTVFPAEVLLTPMQLAGQDVLQATVRDITERKRIEEVLRDSEERFRAVAESATDAIISVSTRSKISFWNHAAENMFGYSGAEILDRPLTTIMPERLRESHTKGFAAAVSTGHSKLIGKSVELAGLRKDGSEFPLELTLSSWKTGEQVFYTGIIRDITERKSAEEKLKTISVTDELTGLHNRRGFFTIAGHQIKLADRTKVGIYMLYADLDNLKVINDTYGHSEGDNALSDFADILKACYRASDVISRLGGDEFAVIPVGIDGDNMDRVTARLQKGITLFNEKKSRRYKLSASSGIAFYDPESPCSLDDLVFEADRLMYEEKKRKKGL